MLDVIIKSGINSPGAKKQPPLGNPRWLNQVFSPGYKPILGTALGHKSEFPAAKPRYCF
jgi:hypothetical protein